MAKKVLIVDDEPNIVISLEFLMQQNGYDVHIARSAEEAMESIRTNRPDLVLLDIMLPNKSGYDVCQEVRANRSLKKIKIVLLTAKGREVDVAKGMALGADAYITKPFSTRDMVKAVETMLAETE